MLANLSVARASPAKPRQNIAPDLNRPITRLCNPKHAHVSRGGRSSRSGHRFNFAASREFPITAPGNSERFLASGCEDVLPEDVPGSSEIAVSVRFRGTRPDPGEVCNANEIRSRGLCRSSHKGESFAPVAWQFRLFQFLQNRTPTARVDTFEGRNFLGSA